MGVGGAGMKAAVFLDRDGTLNRCFPTPDGVTTRPPAAVRELALVEGAVEACDAMRRAGYLLLLVTNQPDVRRGTQTKTVAAAISRRVVELLDLDGALACYHDDADGCDCRKPKPGLIRRLAAQHDIDLARSWMVGDRPTDIAAGRAAGCATVLGRGSARRRRTRPSGCITAFRRRPHYRHLCHHCPREPGVRMIPLDALNIKIYADGADLAGMLKMYDDPLIKGFTTNPTLMRKAGVSDYEGFARSVVAAIPDRPVSFEVLSDDIDAMLSEALTIGDWGDNVYVKVPITTTRGESTRSVIHHLNAAGVKLNVTAILTLEQVASTAAVLGAGTPAVVSVFAGRVADTGRDPVPMMAAAKAMLANLPGVELLWASPRELLNVFHAEQAGCDIITATTDVLTKRHLVGKSLSAYSLETVRMFFEDSSGLSVGDAGASALVAASSR